MRLPCQFRGWLALGRPPGCVAWSALRGPVDWLERLRGEGASAAGTIGACFQPGIVRLGASAVQALRPLRGGLRPAWTTAAPSLGLAAMKARPAREPGGALAGRGTPSPSVVSEMRQTGTCGKGTACALPGDGQGCWAARTR